MKVFGKEQQLMDTLNRIEEQIISTTYALGDATDENKLHRLELELASLEIRKKETRAELKRLLRERWPWIFE